MPVYNVTDPQTGRTVTLRGASPPTEAELNDIFAKLAPTEPTPTSAPVKENTEGGGMFDLPLQAAQSATSVVRSTTDVFGAENVASKELRKVEDYLGGLLSAAGKNDQEKISQIFKDAEDKGGRHLKPRPVAQSHRL